MAERSKSELKARLLQLLSAHVGRRNAIGMGELFSRVYGASWTHRINDTRRLRQLITELRREGTPICSTSGADDGGYYLASVGAELDQYCKRVRAKALRALKMEATLRRVTLKELLGQMAMNL